MNRTQTSNEEIEFWYKHGKRIRDLTRVTENILCGLQRHNFITSFQEREPPKYYFTPDGFRLLFSCFVPYADKHEIRIRFEYALGRSFGKIQCDHRSRFANLVIDANMPKECIYAKLCAILRLWKFGSISESSFEGFLRSLQKELPDRITHAFKTGKNDDANNGIDFIVRYLAKPEYHIKEVAFNLKSSQRFLRKHRELYPTVSTFVFKREDLRNRNALRNRFIKFLFAATNNVIHH